MSAWLVSLVGSLGAVLFASGLPVFRRIPLTGRVEPYVGLPRRARRGDVADVDSRIGAFLGEDDDALTLRLSAAGRDPDPRVFRLLRIRWALTAAVVATPVVGLASVAAGFEAPAAGIFVLLSAATGWSLCDRSLTAAIRARADRLEDELPLAADLLVLSLTAGESVAAGLARVGALLGSESGREFRRVVGDITAGMTTLDALDAMARRAPAPALARLAGSLASAIEHGAPLAENLRAQADDLRRSRRARLLEQGGRREVLMLVPVVFLLLPTIVLFVLYPGLVSLQMLVP